MSIETLTSRTVGLRHRTSAATDSHGNPVMTEEILQIRGHVQPSSGTVGQAEGTGDIAERTATLYAIPPVRVSVGDVIDDGVNAWIVRLPPRPHTRPSSAAIHHVSVDLVWSAPSADLDPTEDLWTFTEW